jgi:hypothetical protein
LAGGPVPLRFFDSLPDEEIERLIIELKPCQMDIFNMNLQEEDRRKALFIAKSFPCNEDHWCYKKEV